MKTQISIDELDIYKLLNQGIIINTSYMLNKWNICTRMYVRSVNTFPAGLLRLVVLISRKGFTLRFSLTFCLTDEHN